MAGDKSTKKTRKPPVKRKAPVVHRPSGLLPAISKNVESVADHLVPDMRRLYDTLRNEMAKSSEVKHMLETVCKLVTMNHSFADRVIRSKEGMVHENELVKASEDIDDDAMGGYEKNEDYIADGPAEPDTYVFNNLPRPRSKSEPVLCRPNTSLILEVIHRNAARSVTKRARSASPTADETGPNKKARKPTEIFVGDWKCRLCSFWNNRIFKTCRGIRFDLKEKCTGERQRDTAIKQIDDGNTRHRGFEGRRAGDWHCDSCNRWHHAHVEHCSNCGGDQRSFQVPYDTGLTPRESRTNNMWKKNYGSGAGDYLSKSSKGRWTNQGIGYYDADPA